MPFYLRFLTSCVYVCISIACIDFSRLRLLKAKLSTETITTEEVSAISSFLMSTTPQIQELFHGDTEALKKFVASNKAMELNKATPSGVLVPVKEDILYRRGKYATTCTLILSGKVMVLAGKDQFKSELGPWNILAADSLLLPDGSYVPDFTAYICSDNVRVIQLQKKTDPVPRLHRAQNRADSKSIKTEHNAVGRTSVPSRSRSPPDQRVSRQMSQDIDYQRARVDSEEAHHRMEIGESHEGSASDERVKAVEMSALPQQESNSDTFAL